MLKVPLVLATTLVVGCADASVTPQRFGACFQAVGADPYGAGGSYYADRGATFSGTVIEAGAGNPPESCFNGEVLVSTGVVENREADWIRFASEGAGEWVVGLWLPGSALPAPEIGEAFGVELAYVPSTEGGVGPAEVELTRDGQVYAYVGIGGAVSDLDPPDGVALRLGASAGGAADGCGGRVERYDLDVNGAAVAYGDITEVDGLEVRHGGVSTSASGACIDQWAGYAAVALIGR